MVLEVVGSDPKVGIKEAIKASPLRVGTQMAPFSSSAMTMGNIGTARPLRDPWYQMKGLFPAVPPVTSMTVSSMYWVSKEFFGSVEKAWIPYPEGIVDLQIKRGVLKPVLLQLDYPSGIVETWVDWVDEELVDNEFVEVLQEAGVFEAIGEFTVTIEDVANLLMLPILGDVDPTRLRLIAAESMIEEELIEGFGGKGASFGGHLAKHSTWVTTFRRRSNESEKYVRCAAFVDFWLTKFVFCEHPHYAMHPLVFRASCRVVASVINMSLLQACLWEHLKEYRSASGLKEGDMTRISYLASVKAARVMGIFVEYVRGGTSSNIPMPGLRVKPPSNFRILHNVASGNCYDSRQGASYVEWHEEKLSWKVFRTHLPPEWASTHSTFIKDEGGRSKKGKRVAEESPVAPIDPSKEGKKKARVHVAPATSFPITSIDVLATSKPVSPSIVVTRGSARRTRRKDEKGSRDLPIDLSVEDKSPSRGEETSAKAVKDFTGNVDAAVDIGNTLIEEGVHVNATAGEFSTLNERIDLDIDLAGDNGVETAGAQTELAPMAGVETHNDSIRDDVIIVRPHTSPATHDSLGIELPPMIESTKVVEPATIAGRLVEEPSRPFNSDDYFAGLGAFLDTMRPSYVSLPMIRDKLIAHAAPTSEGVIDPNNLALIPHGGTSATVSGDGTSSNDSKGLRGGVLDQDAQDPYDDMDDNLVVREVPAPFFGEMVDTSSSSGEDIEVSPARGDDLDLTLRVPYSRLHGELSTFFNVFLLGINEDYGRGGKPRPAFPLATWRGCLSEGSTISTAEGLTQFLEDSTKEIYNDHSPRHFWSLHKRFGDFTSGFKFGCGSSSFYLRLLSDVLCDMRRTLLELVTERKLQDWRGIARKLIDLGFAVDFLLERIRELEAKMNGLTSCCPIGQLVCWLCPYPWTD
uniref:Aminotransferase-like plant mobile domain-containing protein n=1 Tax=Fagus sylvatica TaxID=28930 RepID=A0A2N9H864_FAGSY